MFRSLYLLILLTGLVACKKNTAMETGGEQSPAYYTPPVGGGTWETVRPENIGWNAAAIPDLKKMLEDNRTRAFLVLKGGKIVIEEYFGKNLTGLAAFGQTSYWYWASAGKTLTASLVGKAQEEGYLDIHQPTSAYLGTGWTSLAADQEARITVRNQLTMTTGLDDGVADGHSTNSKDLVFKASPGTRWAYHNGPYTLLENVVTNAANRNFDAYFRTALADRIGMDGSWQWVDNDHVYFSTARSMARFGHLILNRGSWGMDKVLPEAYCAEMVSTSQSLNKSYGYLWWLNGKESYRLPESQLVFAGSLVPRAPSDMVSGMGKNGQYVCVIPSQQLVVVRMGESPESVPVPFLFLNDIWEKLNRVIQ